MAQEEKTYLQQIADYFQSLVWAEGQGQGAREVRIGSPEEADPAVERESPAEAMGVSGEGKASQEIITKALSYVLSNPEAFGFIDQKDLSSLLATRKDLFAAEHLLPWITDRVEKKLINLGTLHVMLTTCKDASITEQLVPWMIGNIREEWMNQKTLSLILIACKDKLTPDQVSSLLTNREVMLKMDEEALSLMLALEKKYLLGNKEFNAEQLVTWIINQTNENSVGLLISLMRLRLLTYKDDLTIDQIFSLFANLVEEAATWIDDETLEAMLKERTSPVTATEVVQFLLKDPELINKIPQKTLPSILKIYKDEIASEDALSLLRIPGLLSIINEDIRSSIVIACKDKLTPDDVVLLVTNLRVVEEVDGETMSSILDLHTKQFTPAQVTEIITKGFIIGKVRQDVPDALLHLENMITAIEESKEKKFKPFTTKEVVNIITSISRDPKYQDIIKRLAEDYQERFDYQDAVTIIKYLAPKGEKFTDIVQKLFDRFQHNFTHEDIQEIMSRPFNVNCMLRIPLFDISALPRTSRARTSSQVTGGSSEPGSLSPRDLTARDTDPQIGGSSRG